MPHPQPQGGDHCYTRRRNIGVARPVVVGGFATRAANPKPAVPAISQRLALFMLTIGCAPPPDLGDAIDTGSGTGSGLPDLDATRLDRQSDGYPGPGPAGYGSSVGARLDNSDGFQLKDCGGTVRDFVEFFARREDGVQNRAILVNIGAGWCGPCQEETLELPEIYAEYRDRGVEFVQVMFQDWASQAPTTGFCDDWRTGRWEGASVDLSLTFPVFIDQIGDWTSIHLQDPAAATPINMLLDANANIRFESEGIKLDADVLRTQLDLVITAPYEAP